MNSVLYWSRGSPDHIKHDLKCCMVVGDSTLCRRHQCCMNINVLHGLVKRNQDLNLLTDTKRISRLTRSTSMNNDKDNPISEETFTNRSAPPHESSGYSISYCYENLGRLILNMRSYYRSWNDSSLMNVWCILI